MVSVSVGSTVVLSRSYLNDLIILSGCLSIDQNQVGLLLAIIHSVEEKSDRLTLQMLKTGVKPLDDYFVNRHPSGYPVSIHAISTVKGEPVTFNNIEINQTEFKEFIGVL